MRSSPLPAGVVANLWAWRCLVGTLAAREVRVRYAGSALGLAWVVLEPLLQFGLYLLVFGLFLGIRFAERGIGGYGVFLVSGLVPYLFLQEATLRALGLARAQSQLLRHLPAPPEVLLGGAVLAVASKFGVGLVLVMGAGQLSGLAHWPALGWLAVGCVLLGALTLGVSLLVFPLGAFAPDAAPVVTLGLQALLFASPVLYPLSALPEPLRGWAQYNPLVGILGCFRAAVAGAPPEPQAAAIAAVAGGVLLLGGGYFFRRRVRWLREVV